MTNNYLRFVFIGCGKIAHFHADVVYAHGHQIVGVAARKNSKNIHVFADKYNIKSLYSDFNLLLDGTLICVVGRIVLIPNVFPEEFKVVV